MVNSQIEQERSILNWVVLGKTWRFSQGSLTVAVPLLLKTPPGQRGYVLAEEVAGLKLGDTGSIDRVSVQGGDKPVLVRGGTILEGAGTQNRAVESGRMVMPGVRADLPVRCVFASSPITPGASM